MRRMGFTCCTTSPGVYYHEKRELRVVTHVDDFLVGGYKEDLVWLKAELTKEFELKGNILGNESGESMEVNFLGRKLRLTTEGITYEEMANMQSSSLTSGTCTMLRL